MATTISSKNVKGNRKVLQVSFRCPDGYYKIPDGLDLNDKSVVKRWYIRRGDLSIEYVDGRTEKIELWNPPQWDDYDYLSHSIEDAEDVGIEYSEDEEEEKEEEKEKENGAAPMWVSADTYSAAF